MKTIKVFNTITDQVNGETPYEEVHKLLEFNGVGNDSYHDWRVDAPGKGEYYVDPNYKPDGTPVPAGNNTEKTYSGGSGGGYLTEADENAIDIWLKALGIGSGEDVLIHHGW